MIIDWFGQLGWHSGTIPDVRNATVPECWNGGVVVNNKCEPGQALPASIHHKKKKGGGR